MTSVSRKYNLALAGFLNAAVLRRFILKPPPPQVFSVVKQRLAAVLRRFAAAVAVVSRKSLKYLMRRWCGGGAAVPPYNPPKPYRARLGASSGFWASEYNQSPTHSPPASTTSLPEGNSDEHRADGSAVAREGRRAVSEAKGNPDPSGPRYYTAHDRR